MTNPLLRKIFSQISAIIVTFVYLSPDSLFYLEITCLSEKSSIWPHVIVNIFPVPFVLDYTSPDATIIVSNKLQLYGRSQ